MEFGQIPNDPLKIFFEEFHPNQLSNISGHVQRLTLFFLSRRHRIDRSRVDNLVFHKLQLLFIGQSKSKIFGTHVTHNRFENFITNKKLGNLFIQFLHILSGVALYHLDNLPLYFVYFRL